MFKANRLNYHSTLGSRAIKKKKLIGRMPSGRRLSPQRAPTLARTRAAGSLPFRFSLSLSLKHTHTLPVSLSHTHSLTHTLSLSLSLSLSPSLCV